MALHELTAGNAILLYSNTLLAEIGGPITPRMGTYIIGVVNFIASSISIFTAKTFSRRALFIGGHLIMGLCHLGIAMFIGINKGAYAFISILAFQFTNQNTSSAITWLYCSEVAVDVALGFVGTSGYFAIFCLTLSIQPMMNSAIG